MRFQPLSKIFAGGLAMMMSMAPLMAQEAASTASELPETPFFSFNTDSLLMIFAIFLLLPIYFLARLLIFGVKINMDKKAKTLTLLGVMMASLSTAQAQSSSFSSFNYVTWLLLIIIAIELLLIAILTYHATELLAYFQKKDNPVSPEVQPSTFSKIWQKINNFRPIEEESELEIGHEYDGIKELDNVTPPWFTFGFVSTIIFAMIYLWIYHVSESAPLQIEEYNREVAIAEAKHAEYLLNQANQVDENTVTLLTDATSIASGKKLYDANCVACHKADGGGLVGPNLTDDYWIHGGSVKDVFSTIKYGVLDKGMVAWKDNMTPNQIAQLVAYIHTLKGTNPAGAKEAEGALYVEGTDAVSSEENTENTNNAELTAE